MNVAERAPSPRPKGSATRERNATLPFTGPWLLAPMEGVTDPAFRNLVLRRHAPHELGGAFTEFVRVVGEGLPRRVLARHLGSDRQAIPVGLQLMGSDLAALAATARRVAELDVPCLDLNFGCPAKGALRGCAGSALLREPGVLEEVVRTCAEAVDGRIPVTAKIRAGYDDDSLLAELACAAQAGGAAMLTVHCRTMREGYQPHADWARIERAVRAVSIPVCGNGGVERHADLERMRAETGCRYVMVGRAALADPWIFGGREVATREAAVFLVEYLDEMRAAGRASPAGAIARVKGLLRSWTAGGLLPTEEQRTALLREREPARIAGWLASAATGSVTPPAAG